jgi:hypothetical protein
MGVKRLGREADHSRPSSAEVKNGGGMCPLIDTTSWRDARLNRHPCVALRTWKKGLAVKLVSREDTNVSLRACPDTYSGPICLAREQADRHDESHDECGHTVRGLAALRASIDLPRPADQASLRVCCDASQGSGRIRPSGPCSSGFLSNQLSCKNTYFWDVTWCSLVDIYRYFGEICCSHPQNTVRRFLRNVGIYVPDCTTCGRNIQLRENIRSLKQFYQNLGVQFGRTCNYRLFNRVYSLFCNECIQ